YQIQLEPGTLIFASPNQIKQLPADEKTVRGFHLVFKSAFLEHFFQDKLFVYRLSFFYNYSHPPYLKIDEATFKLISTCLNEIISEINHHQSDSQEIIRSLLFFMLTKLNRSFKQFHQLDQHWKKEDTLIRFKMAIEAHIRSNKNVNDYADLLGLHRNVLNRQIKTLSGLNASDFLANRKLQEIKSRLFFSDYTIAEIAYDLSFSDPNNMTRFFKKRTGISPTQFRQQVQIDR
ncbi:MAG: AraC family transcriptional regulator, partial [Bacteroidota bacterium]